MMAAGMATLIETFSDWFRSVWASQFFHQFNVQQVNLAVWRSPWRSLNPYMIIRSTGLVRYRIIAPVNTGRM